MKDSFKKITIEQRQDVAKRFHSCSTEREFHELLLHTIAILDFSDDTKAGYSSILRTFKLSSANNDYTNFFIKKSSGKDRVISAPTFSLKLIHRLINFVLSCVFEGHPNSFGYKISSSVVSNALGHVNQNFVYHLDLIDFFSAIDSVKIKSALYNAPFNLGGERKAIAARICRLCTMIPDSDKEKLTVMGTEAIRILPQGAPTSPILSNAVCLKMDKMLTALAKKYNIIYSRYADDITFSSKYNVFDKKSAFISEVEEIIDGQKFKINDSKTRLQRSKARQEVTGLIVNSKVNVKRKFIKSIRMYLHYWERYGYSKAEEKFFFDKKIIIGRQKATLYSTLDGRLNYLKMVKGVDDSTYIILLKRFKKVANTILVPGNQKASIANTDDFTEHKPSDVARFLKFFQDSDGLKYLTHDYDIPGKEFDYDMIMDFAGRDFNRAFKNYSITKALYAKVKKFAFDKKPEWWRWENGKKIDINIGWNSNEVKEWVHANPGIHPIRSKLLRDKLIKPFKESIQFRSPALRFAMEETVREKFGEDYDSFDIEYKNLEAAEFYTDVDLILGGIRHLLDGILERISVSNKIRIAFKREIVGEHAMKILEITHIDSKCYKPAASAELLNGNFMEVQKLFRGLCNWSILSQFEDGVFEISMLTDNSQNVEKAAVKENKIIGFTHILSFY